MKCKNCDGTGFIPANTSLTNWFPCRKCNGTGRVDVGTWEEYIKSCNTEELAEVLREITHRCWLCAINLHYGEDNQCKVSGITTGRCLGSVEGWKEWLKMKA